MAKRSLFGSFVNSYIRQMGRESAHSAYGILSGKSLEIKNIEGEDVKVSPLSFKENFKLFLLAALLPGIGCVITLVKSAIRVSARKVRYCRKDTEMVYRYDRRYKDAARPEGAREVNRYGFFDARECPAEDVAKYRRGSVPGLVISLLFVAFYAWMGVLAVQSDNEKRAMIQTYSTWQQFTSTDEFTGKVTSYEFVLPVKDSLGTVSPKFALVKENGGVYIYSEDDLELESPSYDKYTLELKCDGKLSKYTVKRYYDGHSRLDEAQHLYHYYSYKVEGFRVPKESLAMRQKDVIYVFNLK